jgi:hypothetical protein
MKYIIILLTFLAISCGTGPGRLKQLTKNGIPYQKERTSIDVAGAAGKKISVQYTGCGGIYILRGNDGIMIDPFFSNQKVMKIGKSVLGGGNSGKRKLASDSIMVGYGIRKIEAATGRLDSQVRGIFTAHSHYDHLMDVPAIFGVLNKKPTVYVNQSGYNICYNVIDRSKMEVLEAHMTTKEITRAPIELDIDQGKIRVYPILSEHNPHVKYIKFFSGSKTHPVADFKNPYQKTRANDWLEGNTFSFLIDYLNEVGTIDFRIFIQSSSCNPMAGIPPAELLKRKQVDLAFLGVASYHFSPDYPCTLLSALTALASESKSPKVVWIHWEDFFRNYSRKPKSVRATDVVNFFDKPCVRPYKADALLPWPGVVYDLK